MTAARLVAVFLAGLVAFDGLVTPYTTAGPVTASTSTTVSATSSTPVANLSASVNRVVELLGVCGSGLLAIVWARVAVSWFSHDVTKKIQAKERARDALVGTLLFTAALTGLIWSLAHWVLTGS